MKCLIVVDMQNDFIDGPLGTPESRAIVSKVRDKIDSFVLSPFSTKPVVLQNYKLLIYTKDTHDKDYMNTQEGSKLPIPHCIEDTHGWYVHKDLFGNNKVYTDYELSNDPIHLCRVTTVCKSTFGYDWKKLRDHIELVEDIELVGVCTDICVISNALILKSLFPEIPIKVDAKCCAGTTPEAHEAALKVMESCQIEVIR